VTATASMSAGAPVFEARGVGKTYRQGRQPVDVVSNVDLTIGAGEFVVIAGPSGSGKTTLLNLLGGLDRPDRGVLRFAGADWGAMPEAGRVAMRRNRLGFIFQAFNLVPVLTAYENVEYGLWLCGVPSRERRARVEDALGAVGLAHRLTHRPDQLSGGERQRVALARAVAHTPLAILADEPTASLDSRTGADVLALFRHLNETHGTTFVVATHDPSIVAMAPRVLHLHDGQIASPSGGPA
jgi:putative ABC transport system ATP-binding protein